jgi:hypothetical protein
MPIGTAAKGEIILVSEADKIGKGVMFAVVKDSTDIGYGDCW